MKKFSIQIIASIVLLLVYSGVNAQCTISPHAQPGFYPTSQHGIHPAAATQLYDLNITIVVPADTIIPSIPVPVPIDSIRVQSFIGFPAGFQYYYNTPTGWIKGGTAGCMRIYGTPGISDIGTHSISIAYSVVVGGFALPDTLKNYWQFEIKDATHVSVDLNDNNTGSVSLFPNPASDNLEVIVPGSGMSAISIFNTSGRLVMRYEAEMNAGIAHPIDLSGLKAGLYFISINQPTGSFTERFILSK